MHEQELIRKSYEALERDRQLPAKQQLQRLIDSGVIDERGRVLLWDFFLGVIAVKWDSSRKRILHFRCLKPLPGMPGATQIDVHRDSLVRYIGEENKRVVTAYLDEKQNRWKEDAEVHLTSRGYLRKDANDIDEDNLGTLPEFDLVQSRL
jgi:hypothetical protein